MDHDVFDNVARQAAGGSSRRGLVRAGLGALGLTGLGLLTIDETDAKNKKRNRNKKRCKGDRPLKCGKGCCPAEFPNCCEFTQQANVSVAFSCTPPSFTCCSVTTGGGACPAGATCCPPTQNPRAVYGGCAAAGETCCPANSTGIACPAGALCSVNNACPVGYTFDFVPGCCIPDVAGRVASESRSRSTPRFIMKAR
jgi:hypothetical protein